MKKRIMNALWLMCFIASCTESPKQNTPIEQNLTINTPNIDNAKIAMPLADTTKTTWRCFGTEPFWAIEISEAKNTIVFRPMEGDSITMPYVKPLETNNTWTFEAAKLKAVIKKEKCSDGMSDIEHQFSSKVTVGGNNFIGCASTDEIVK